MKTIQQVPRSDFDESHEEVQRLLAPIKILGAKVQETLDPDGFQALVAVETNLGQILVAAGVPVHHQGTAKACGSGGLETVEAGGNCPYEWLPEPLEGRPNDALDAVHNAALEAWKA